VTHDELELLARPQPAPIPNTLPPVVDGAMGAVRAIVDGREGRDLARILLRRSELGRAEYGTELQPHNGRKVAVDALQEAVDLVMYASQGLLETHGADRLDWAMIQCDSARLARRILELHRRTERRRQRLAGGR